MLIKQLGQRSTAGAHGAAQIQGGLACTNSLNELSQQADVLVDQHPFGFIQLSFGLASDQGCIGGKVALERGSLLFQAGFEGCLCCRIACERMAKQGDGK
ncbi:hypothetical protein SDC9_155227 [bioreactor metagenome]|uniref:Uncharacterized protein n=1 Tax=bioreactor metagenome TaxID=1076179 RepID=A0A645F356_9ZZZZ